MFSTTLYLFFKCPTVPQSHQLLKHTMFSPPPSTFFQVSHCPSVPPAAKAYYVFSSSLYFFFKCPTVPQSHQLIKHTMCSPLPSTFSSAPLSLSPTSC